MDEYKKKYQMMWVTFHVCDWDDLNKERIYEINPKGQFSKRVRVAVTDEREYEHLDMDGVAKQFSALKVPVGILSKFLMLGEAFELVYKEHRLEHVREEMPNTAWDGWPRKAEIGDGNELP